MNVLSLFDGISCARVALQRVGLPVKTYFAAEIDPHAIQISKRNWNDVQHIGDVRQIKAENLPPIDLLIGGSPCQDLSIAKKGRKGLEGERSSLFWEYVRLLNELNPKYFVLENVASMSPRDKFIISTHLKCEPIKIDAALVSAQSRKRLFWTNLPVVGLPADRGICLKDILQPDAEIDERMVTTNGKAFCLTASYEGAVESNSVQRRQRTMVKIGYVGDEDRQGNRVYADSGKAATLCVRGGGGLVGIGRDVGRRLTEAGTREDSNKDLPVQRRVELRDDDKTGTLTSVAKDNLVVQETRVRKLTPIECERLQGLPDDYTQGVAKTHRYCALGNAFNVDVIAFLLSHIPSSTP